MKHYRHFKVFSLFLLLIAIEIVVVSSLENKQRSEHPSKTSSISTYPLMIKGLKLQAYAGDMLESSLRAGEAKINPRQFFVFNIKALNELSFNDVTLEFHRKSDGVSGINFKNLKFLGFSGVRDGSRSSKTKRRREIRSGLITRGVINDIVFSYYHENNLKFTIKARKAYINFRKNTAKFKDATIENYISKDIIKSRVVLLAGDDLKLKVPGKYVLLSSSGVKKGQNLEMML